MEGRAPPSRRKWADLGAYETKKNPDADQEYGFVAPTAECAAQWPVKQAGPPTYTGLVDSHPYSSYTTADGAYVGEAGGNSILWVDNDGKISTVGILPPTEVTMTQAAADALKAPACVGLQYRLEPVPTDVELGPDGWLYISSLPGGPEDDSLGMNGRVYKMNPKSGKVKLVASGFLGTVDLAVANNGDIYVAQLFGGQISRIKAGSRQGQALHPGRAAWRGRVEEGRAVRHRQRPVGRRPPRARWCATRSDRARVATRYASDA